MKYFALVLVLAATGANADDMQKFNAYSKGVLMSCEQVENEAACRGALNDILFTATDSEALACQSFFNELNIQFNEYSPQSWSLLLNCIKNLRVVGASQ